jgi:apolipoprotein N-acyltransferase
VALIQGSFDAELNAPRSRNEEIQSEYLRLSRYAIRKRPDVDLIVWPETMFSRPLLIYDEETFPPSDADWNVEDLRRAAEAHRWDIAALAQEMETDLLLGISIFEYGRGTIDGYNSAIHVSPEGCVVGRYDKMSPVMFGEYMPLADYIPTLQKISPLTGGIEAGNRALGFTVEGTIFCPSICYEDVLPHVIRRQIRQLADDDQEVDVLVNLTNDGWYYGSSELDMHLICAVFRAVEFRKPMLVAANTGFSAWIDANGRIVKQGPRRATDVIVADVSLDDRRSGYLAIGDLLAGLCLVVSIGLVAGAAVDRVRRRRQEGADAS